MQRIYKLFSSIVFFLYNNAECSSILNQLEFKLQGNFENKIVLLKPHSLVDNERINKRINTYTSSCILFEAESKMVKYDITYGIKIALHLLNDNSGEKASSAYFEYKFGKVEIGSDRSSYDKMKIVSEAPRADYVSLNSLDSNLIYYMGFDNFIDSKMRDTGKVEYSRKITYYTPKFNNIQLGISFIPDSSNMGYAHLSEPQWHAINQDKYYLKVTNGTTLGVSYSYKINEEFKVETSLVNELGKVNWRKKSYNAENTPIFHNLNTYTGGIKLSFKRHLLAISYSYLGNSLKAVDAENRGSKIYGISYGHKYYLDNIVNIGFLKSSYNNNIFNALGVTLNYQPIKGLETYLGLTRFSADSKYKSFDINKSNKRSGWVTIIGTKIVL